MEGQEGPRGPAGPPEGPGQRAGPSHSRDLSYDSEVLPKSQPRTEHTREPDPTHNELKHTITRF